MGNDPDNQFVFGDNAPSRNLAFPEHGANMTAMELITFHPYCLRNAKVIHRFVSNGMAPKQAAIMVNFSRNFPNNPTTGNTILKMMGHTMELYGCEGWNTSRHKLYFPGPWVNDLIAVDGFSVPAADYPDHPTSKEGVTTKFPFKDFAKDVRVFPEGFDALDFTECVRYAFNHPHEDWFYPQDYEELVRKTNGPREVLKSHCDAELFKRWSTIDAFNAKTYLRSGKLNAGAVSQDLEPETEDEDDVAFNDTFTQGPHLQNQEAQAFDEGLHHGPTTRDGQEPTDNNVIGYHQATTSQFQPDLPFVQEAPANVESRQFGILRIGKPPSFLQPPSRPTLNLFQGPVDISDTGHSASGLALHMPYSFSGPRTAPEYRTLHWLQDPFPDDVSDFAENIRWAKEQYRLYHVSTWSESPEDMATMSQARIQEAWVSPQFAEWIESSKNSQGTVED